MFGKKLRILFIALGLLLGLSTTAAPAFATAKEKMLHSFSNNGKDGTNPSASLIFDKSGRLYGETEVGGVYGDGTVFELRKNCHGQWKEEVLHSFNGNDGTSPGGSLVFDKAGRLYGTTAVGGASGCSGYGCGTVFELIPGANGQWSEKVLYSFSGHADGGWPRGGVIFDAAGNLFGATDCGGAYSGCGACGCGTVFELVRGAKGKWTEEVLYSFDGGFDGEYPQSGLILDAQGNLYGTTGAGGYYGAGTVFELVRGSHGDWTEKVLHGFTYDNYGEGVVDPWASLVFDAAGNLYGTTAQGGAFWQGCAGFGCGTVFQLKHHKGGTWTFNVLHSFGGNGDGTGPYANVILDDSGDLYGTTYGGGANGSGCVPNWGCGTVFELTKQTDGGWTAKILHSFQNGKDASNPFSGLIRDQAGDLFGAGFYGGAHASSCPLPSYGCGGVFEITP